MSGQHQAMPDRCTPVRSLLSLLFNLIIPIGHSTTEEVMQEAQNCLSSVVFNPVSNRDLHNNPDNSFEPPPDTPYSGYEQDPLRNSTSSNNNRLSNSTNTSQAPQLPPFRRQTPDFRDERPLDLPESPARHPSTLGPPLLPPVLHGNHSFGSMDQRSSLAYMEAPNQDPVPIQFARSNEDITPNGPPREYSASGGQCNLCSSLIIAEQRVLSYRLAPPWCSRRYFDSLRV